MTGAPLLPTLAQLTDTLPPHPRTRFAPSPTGYLHLGHVVNALYVWSIARALGGRVLLRIEDHDATRCRSEFERAIHEDLAWLGLTPDESTPRQSGSGPVYSAALARLAGSYKVYACDCSRRTLAQEVEDVFGEETRYPGRCRDRDLPPGSGRGMRIAMAPGVETFVDAWLGPQSQEPALQCGDLLVRDRLGNWTYQLAVTVDDGRQGIDLVIRGEDLLQSTGRQIRLARMLGRAQPPVFLHHPLIRKPGGDKLSKAGHDTGLRELRAGGATPASVLHEAAARGALPLELLDFISAT